jgi:hypothetical protein
MRALGFELARSRVPLSAWNSLNRRPGRKGAGASYARLAACFLLPAKCLPRPSMPEAKA